MRMSRSIFHATDDRGPVGTTSGSGGAEHFVTPKQSTQAHLKPPTTLEPTTETNSENDSDIPPTPPRDDIG